MDLTSPFLCQSRCSFFFPLYLKSTRPFWPMISAPFCLFFPYWMIPTVFLLSLSCEKGACSTSFFFTPSIHKIYDFWGRASRSPSDSSNYSFEFFSSSHDRLEPAFCPFFFLFTSGNIAPPPLPLSGSVRNWFPPFPPFFVGNY